ncbi:MAG: hypothetical protein Q8867_09585, partial [Bacteroidota bacterium]|nr:hypothetical protein [Bacteroidota bacterium]
KIGKDANETLPMVYLAGISWQTSRSILLSVEGGKETDQKAIGRFGLEYHIAKPAWIRVGILSQPVEFTFGAGIASGKFRFDLSSSWHRILGYSFQSSVSYSFF